MDPIKKLKSRAGIPTDDERDHLSEGIREKIILKKSIEALTLSADDWELYTNKPGAEKVAQQLNTAFMSAVNNGLSAGEVEDSIHQVMNALKQFGAYDTEPRYVLRVLLRKVFGQEYEE